MSDEQEVRIVELGAGRYVINHGVYGGKPAAFIEPSPVLGAVGKDASDSGLDRDKVAAGGVIIVFSHSESAEVLRDEIKACIPPGEVSEDVVERIIRDGCGPSCNYPLCQNAFIDPKSYKCWGVEARRLRAAIAALSSPDEALAREVERRREAEAQRDRLAAELPLLRKQCEERQSVYSELIAECERWRATEARIAKQGEDAIREAARQQLIINSTPCPKCGADWGLVARCAADDCPSAEARLEIFRAALDLEEPDALIDRQGGSPDA